MLPACIASLAALAPDELVIVDTGSTDRTVEIAKAAGARVEHFEWIDDFATARNYSIAQCRSEWIFWLDADDRLASGAGTMIRSALPFVDDDAASVHVHMQADEGASVDDVASHAANCLADIIHARLLRRAAGPRFVGRVHEDVSAWLEERGMASVGLIAADVVHIGSPPTLRERLHKSDRNRRLLLQLLAEDANNIRAMYYIAIEAIGTDRAEVLAWVDRACRTPIEVRRASQDFPGLVAMGASCHLAAGDVDAAEAMARRAHDDVGGWAQLSLLLGEVEMRRGRHWHAVARFHEAYAFACDRRYSDQGIANGGAAGAWLGIANVYGGAGMHGAALDALDTAEGLASKQRFYTDQIAKLRALIATRRPS